ncbi:MBL fold metallo-hydrolase [Orenia marismortui]|uniref:MBL fold metallo-hydrolase n=1 Tax=Orenia marismortui TaxID=46469 RepID=UPI00036F8459|nr:MBL fold metallo-hydrolase [Orenia marismortui]
MNLKRFIVGVGDVNCYIINDRNNVGLIVDPGGDKKKLINYIKDNDIDLKAIVLTHYHYDHILAVEDLKAEFNLDVWIHEEDVEGLSDAGINLSADRPVKNINIKADRALKDGENICIGEMDLEIIHTPGHTPGGICIKVENTLLTGDTLFKGSVGRTDLFGGSYDKLLDSVINKLLPLDDNLRVYPGHYLSSKLGIEKKRNPKIQRMLRLVD